MRRIWGFASASALLVFVLFAIWALLSTTVRDPTAPRSMLIALGGAIVMAIGLTAGSLWSTAFGKLRRFIGAVGLIVACIAAFLALLALVTDPAAMPGLLLVTVGATAAWAQGIAASISLSTRASFAWLVVMGVFAAGVVVTGAIAVAVSVALFGSEDRTSIRVGFVMAIAIATAILVAWAGGRPDRMAIAGVLRRAALGRAAPGDLALLPAGPVRIFRRLPIDRSAADVRFAATDARLAPEDGRPDA